MAGRGEKRNFGHPSGPRSPCVQFLHLMKYGALWNWPDPVLRKQFGKMEAELVANELEGSRDSVGIGLGELTKSGFTLRQWCRRKRMKRSGTAGRERARRLLGYNYTLIKRSCWRESHTFHISFGAWLLIIRQRWRRLANTGAPLCFCCSGLASRREMVDQRGYW